MITIMILYDSVLNKSDQLQIQVFYFRRMKLLGKKKRQIESVYPEDFQI